MTIERNGDGVPVTITITMLDDWHLHVRDGDMMARVVPYTAARFNRAIIMPNLQPPVTTVVQAHAYRERILAVPLPEGVSFEPLMTLYLTDETPPGEIRKIVDRKSGVYACKLYPAGATTNSESGVTKLSNIHRVLEVMEREGVPLLVHGEVTDSEVDIFDREARFIDDKLVALVREHPELRIVLEHVTTLEGVSFVEGSGPNVAATITAHHLLENRNAMLMGGMRPHNYCLPVAKREMHRQALVRAAISGNPRFFLGTDSAPHDVAKKENACGCAGCFTAIAALELYAEVFERANALGMLEPFASHYGPDFYGLSRNSGTVTLVKRPWTMPNAIEYEGGSIVPFWAGKELNWRMTM